MRVARLHLERIVIDNKVLHFQLPSMCPPEISTDMLALDLRLTRRSRFRPLMSI